MYLFCYNKRNVFPPMDFIANTTAVIIVIITLLLLATAVVNLFFRVPYVPSKMSAVIKMVSVAELKNGDVVYDLGCGDGRLLFEAEKQKKIDARGYEAAPIPYLLAKAKKLFLRSKTKISLSNFFKANLKDADVIFCYLGPEVMSSLMGKIKNECRKGTRIISNTFQLKEMVPSKIWEKDPKKHLPSIYLYEI